MIKNLSLLFVFLVAVNAISFGSDSCSCEDDNSYGGGGGGHHHGGGHGEGNRGCPEGWRRFRRSTGGWCMKVFGRINIEPEHAANACAVHGAVLSGIQNSEERRYLLSSIGSTNITAATGSLWLGAKRTDACIGSKLTATCSKTTSFAWTDGVTTGTAGFSWLDGSQPDNALGGRQNCIAFFFAPSNTVIASVTWFPGAMDDVNCYSAQFIEIPQRRFHGYVCGKEATS